MNDLPTARTNRLAHLDALRGVAALVVVFQHAGEVILRILGDHGPILGLLRQLTFETFNLGKFGVVVFFAISGFVIPFSFKGERPLLRFVVSRVMRLYPAYWLSMAIAVPVGLAIGVSYTWPQVAANLTMIQTALRQTDILGVYWTLFIEILFYGLCVATFVVGRIRSAGYMIAMMSGFLGIALAMGVMNYFHAKSLPTALPMGLAIMHFGALTRLLLVEHEPSARRWFPYAAGVLAVTIGPICMLSYGKDVAHGGFVPYVTSYAVALGVFLLCVFRRWFVSPATVFLGKISYALYLFHAIAILVALPAGRAVPTAFAPLTVILIAASAIPVSYLVFIWIEKPMIDLGHKIASRLERPRAELERAPS